MRLFFLFAFIIIFNQFLNAQKLDGYCNGYPYFGELVKDFSFYSYTPYIELKEKYKSIKQAKNETPEELIISIISERNAEWSTLNYGKNKSFPDSHYQRIISQDPEQSYVELIFKVNYNYNDTEFALLKINAFDENNSKPVSISITCFKKEKQWYVSDNKQDADLDFILMLLNQEALEAIFENKSHTNPQFSALVKKAWSTDNMLNLSLVIKDIKERLYNNDESISSIIDDNNPFNPLR